MSAKVLDSCAVITLLGLLLRWIVSLYPYSGAGKPPMFGDYEAQRHWQEITVNLDLNAWYTNSTNNDLLYWGLDYPPLTAYHSWLVGVVARKLDPAYVTLNESHGFESYDHKLFMRYTVFIVDLIIYLPAAFMFRKAVSDVKTTENKSNLCFLALMLYPGIYLIDYGHFQYNNMSLGLFVAAVAAVLENFDCLGSVLFSLALNYKQMELYHALPFFFFLIGKCFKEQSYDSILMKLFSISGSVVLTFLIIWAPYLENYQVFAQVVSRVFPFSRGLFEDKVASVWCTLSVFVKFKSVLSQSHMALLCMVSTGAFCIPSCLNLLVNVTEKHFRYALVNIALIFFLFSYHVHEKSILLVTVPACLIFNEEPFMVTWLFIISNLSMMPLLDKDGLLVPFISLTLLTLLMYWLVLAYMKMCNYKTHLSKSPYYQKIILCFWCSIAASVVLTLCYKLLEPPAHYPDLFPVLIAGFSCVHFCLFGLYFHYRQFGLSDKSKKIKRKQK